MASTQTIPAGKWQIDPVHSSVEFLVLETSSRFTAIKGYFTDFEGTLQTTGNANGWSLSGVIRPNSLTTAQEQRDAHLRSPDFLNTAAYPEIRFTSDKIDSVGDDTIRVTGHLTMQGQPQPVTINAKVVAQGKTDDGTERVVLSGSGELAFGPMTVQIATHASASKVA